MMDEKMVAVAIPVQGIKDRRLWKIGEAEIDGNSILLTMEETWTRLVTDLVKNGAEIEAIVINIDFRAARKAEPDGA